MLKAVFRPLLAVIVFLYRRTGGKIGGTMLGLRVLLLTTTGRKTGRQWTTPLGYFEHDGGYVVIASNAGSDSHPAWFHNLKRNPQVTLQIQDRQVKAVAEPAGPELRKQLWARLVELAPGYKGYEQRTRREIPVVLLRPVT
jgi:deazaflavin-dependent oxidoreductase (nitroreductase family)